MPAKTEKQRRFMGAELSRARAGKKTQTGMSEDKLSEFASKSIDKALFKSVDMINAYLFKHGHILPCGHHAEDGDAIDKACTMGGCSAFGGTVSAAGLGATLSSAPVTSSVTGEQTTIGALPGANTHVDRDTGVSRTSFTHTATGAAGDVDDFI